MRHLQRIPGMRSRYAAHRKNEGIATSFVTLGSDLQLNTLNILQCLEKKRESVVDVSRLLPPLSPPVINYGPDFNWAE